MVGKYCLGRCKTGDHKNKNKEAPNFITGSIIFFDDPLQQNGF